MGLFSVCCLLQWCQCSCLVVCLVPRPRTWLCVSVSAVISPLPKGLRNAVPLVGSVLQPLRLRSGSCRQRSPFNSPPRSVGSLVAGMRCLRPTAIQIENRGSLKNLQLQSGFCPATGPPRCLSRYTSGPPSASSLRSRGKEYKQTPSLLARIPFSSRSDFTQGVSPIAPRHPFEVEAKSLKDLAQREPRMRLFRRTQTGRKSEFTHSCLASHSTLPTVGPSYRWFFCRTQRWLRVRALQSRPDSPIRR